MPLPGVHIACPGAIRCAAERNGPGAGADWRAGEGAAPSLCVCAPRWMWTLLHDSMCGCCCAAPARVQMFLHCMALGVAVSVGHPSNVWALLPDAGVAARWHGVGIAVRYVQQAGALVVARAWF
eukprot:366514-Chlamydomonas_euryale.AAC.6